MTSRAAPNSERRILRPRRRSTRTRQTGGHRGVRGLRRTVRPVPVALTVILVSAFLGSGLGAGAGAARAGWTAPERPATASVTAGTLGVTLSGFAALRTVYSSAALAATAPVTVRNTGSVPVPYTLTLASPAVTALATAVSVRAWPVATAAACTPAAAAAGTPGLTWVTVGPLTGVLAPGASTVYCMRSSVTQAQRFVLLRGTVTVTATLIAGQGTWTSTATASAAQSVADTLTPGAPTATGATDSSVTLGWAAPADTAAVTGYRIVRDGVVIGTVPAATRTFTDLGLTVATGHSYTVQAVDAAFPVDVSPASAASILSTTGPTATGWYSIRNTTSQLCVDGEAAAGVEGTALISFPCKTVGASNQNWQFVATGVYVRVAARYAPTLFWDSANTNASILRGTAKTSSQQWTVVEIAPGSGTFLFRNRNNMCLDVTGGTTATGNTQLRVASCDASAHQTFTLTNGG